MKSNRNEFCSATVCTILCEQTIWQWYLGTEPNKRLKDLHFILISGNLGNSLRHNSNIDIAAAAAETKNRSAFNKRGTIGRSQLNYNTVFPKRFNYLLLVFIYLPFSVRLPLSVCVAVKWVLNWPAECNWCAYDLYVVTEMKTQLRRRARVIANFLLAQTIENGIILLFLCDCLRSLNFPVFSLVIFFVILSIVVFKLNAGSLNRQTIQIATSVCKLEKVYYSMGNSIQN